MAPGPQSNCSAFTAMCTNCLTCGTMPGHVTLCGYVERQYKFTLMFWSVVNQQVVENGTCTGIHITTQRVEKFALFILCLSVVRAGSLKNWAVLALVELQQRVGRQTSQHPSRSGVAKAKERHLISSLRASQHNLCKSQMFQCTLQSQSDFLSCAVALSTSI